MLSFLVGNVFNEYYTDASQVGTWPETAEINANAQASCILGFAFDSEPVATQIAQCSAVAEEYLPALNCGAVDVDSTLEAFNAALKDARRADHCRNAVPDRRMAGNQVNKRPHQDF